MIDQTLEELILAEEKAIQLLVQRIVQRSILKLCTINGLKIIRRGNVKRNYW
jgi:hypothetical protein